ncbi:MAG TPA: pitrilysin family protein [Spirochaetia bacterium]|nr:pitrilysin family protein [Spirochaetia bacterium]
MTNRSRATVAILLAVALVSLAGCTSQSAAIAPTGSAVDVVRTTLDNGLRVVVVRDPLAPVVTQQITYFAGSKESPAGFPGTAHAQEHMMFRGASGLSGDQLSQISAQLGGNMDAFTTEDTTSYYFTVPASDLDVTLKIGAIRMSSVDDRQSDWEKERGAIEQEVARDNSNPLYVLESKAQAAVFAGTPYEDTGLGTKPTFDNTNATLLKSFYDSWYAPNNALLVVAGDVDPAKVTSKIRELYGSIPKRNLPARPAFNLKPVAPQTFSSTTDQSYGIVAFVFRMPGYQSPDYATARLMARVLDSQRGALTELAYQGKTLNSGFSYQAMVRGGYAYAWAAFPAGTDPKKIETEVRDAVEKSKAGVAPDLIAAERSRAILATELQSNSVSGLVNAWTNAVALQGLDSPAKAASLLENVSAREVTTEMAGLLDFNHAITLVLTPSSSNGAAHGGQVFGAPESFGSTSQSGVELPEWAAKSLALLPDPKPQFHPTVYDMANGLRLIVQPLKGSRAVSLYGSVHTNEKLQAPKGQEGVENLLNALFEWGPKDMTRESFQAAMDSIGADFSAGTDFSLDVLPSSFETGVRLLSDDLLNPALPAEAFSTQQPLQAQDMAGQLQSPVFTFRHKLQAALVPDGDPSVRLATPETIRSLTLADVRSYFETVVRPDETTIVVMGDVTASAVRQIIEKYFGNWKARGPRPNLHYKPVPPSAAQNIFVSDPVRQQNEVVMAETVGLTYDDPAHYAITLGNDFLGGSSFASPLYRELRVKRGLVYSAGSAASFAKTRGYFYIEFGAYPQNVPEAKQIAIQVLQQMAATPLTDQELHLAKASELRQIELSNESASDVAHSWIGYSQEGLSLDRLYKVAAHYRVLTAAEIQTAFQKYVEPARLSTLMLGQPTK